MKTFLAYLLTAVLSVVFVSMAMAQSISVPEVNVLSEIGKLVLNWGSMADLSKGIAIVMILVQLVKQATDFEYKRLLVVVFSILYGVGSAVFGGSGLLEAIVAIMISGGGAVALYEVLKPLLKKIPGLKIGS